MNWKIKAYIQRAMAAIPAAMGDWMNFQMQKRIGLLRTHSPEAYAKPAVDYLQRITAHGRDFSGKSFLEIGTGRRPTTALFLWLCGAEKVVTVDLNRLLNEQIFMGDVAFIVSNETRVREILGALATDEFFTPRFAVLKDVATQPGVHSADILSAANIDYRAPADARNLDLPDASIDYHISANVFEHIPPEALPLVLGEASRILTTTGLLMHFIDYSDHFRTIDAGISQINFLQYSDAEWDKWAGNRFAYHNRLRSDDFQEIFADAGFRFIEYEARVDDAVPALLESGELLLDERFASKSADVLSCVGAFVVAERQE